MKWKYQHVKIIIQTLFKIAPLCPDFAFEMLTPAFWPRIEHCKRYVPPPLIEKMLVVKSCRSEGGTETYNS